MLLSTAALFQLFVIVQSPSSERAGRQSSALALRRRVGSSARSNERHLVSFFSSAARKDGKGR